MPEHTSDSDERLHTSGERQARKPEIGVILGSASDLDRVGPVFSTLEDFQAGYEVAVISAHRTPGLLAEYASTAPGRGIKVIIAAAGLSAALPGALAALVDIPVVGLPLDVGTLKGIDALLSVTQMPPGVPVASVGIDNPKNAALLALRILGVSSPEVLSRLASYRESMAQDTVDKGRRVSEKGLPAWSR